MLRAGDREEARPAGVRSISPMSISSVGMSSQTNNSPARDPDGSTRSSGASRRGEPVVDDTGPPAPDVEGVDPAVRGGGDVDRVAVVPDALARLNGVARGPGARPLAAAEGPGTCATHLAPIAHLRDVEQPFREVGPARRREAVEASVGPVLRQVEAPAFGSTATASCVNVPSAGRSRPARPAGSHSQTRPPSTSSQDSQVPQGVGPPEQFAGRAGEDAVGVANLAVGTDPHGRPMPRPVTLFTGQWADLPLDDLAAKCGGWGFDGLELACWGDHFEVDRALERRRLLRRAARRCSSATGSACWAIGAHLVGQAVCDPIDERHRAILPARGLGRRRPRGRAPARGRADEGHRARRGELGVDVVTGFTGSPIWHLLYSFPPNDSATIERGYEEFAERWGPIIDVFERRGRALRARGPPDRDRLRLRHDAQALDGDRRPRGLRHQLRPEPPEHQFLDPAAFIARVRRPDLPRARQGREARGSTDAARSSASHLNFGDPAAAGTSSRPATATSTSRRSFRALNRIGYQGPLSIEWEDSGMDREWGAPDALAFVRRTDFPPSAVAFDAAFARREMARSASSRWARPRGRRDPDDRRRHARLRVHGQGARQRLPDARRT